MHTLIELRIYQSTECTPLTIHKTVTHRTSIGGKHSTNVIFTYVLHVLIRCSFEQLDKRYRFAIYQQWLTICIDFTKQLGCYQTTLHEIMQWFHNLAITPIACRIECSHEPTWPDTWHIRIITDVFGIATQSSHQIHEVLV